MRRPLTFIFVAIFSLSALGQEVPQNVSEAQLMESITQIIRVLEREPEVRKKVSEAMEGQDITLSQEYLEDLVMGQTPATPQEEQFVLDVLMAFKKELNLKEFAVGFQTHLIKDARKRWGPIFPPYAQPDTMEFNKGMGNIFTLTGLAIGAISALKIYLGLEPDETGPMATAIMLSAFSTITGVLTHHVVRTNNGIPSLPYYYWLRVKNHFRTKGLKKSVEAFSVVADYLQARSCSDRLTQSQ